MKSCKQPSLGWCKLKKRLNLSNYENPETIYSSLLFFFYCIPFSKLGKNLVKIKYLNINGAKLIKHKENGRTGCEFIKCIADTVRAKYSQTKTVQFFVLTQWWQPDAKRNQRKKTSFYSGHKQMDTLNTWR